MQAANAFATLARGGEIRDARIISDVEALPPDRRSGTLDMPAEACRRALEGLRQAVEEKHGTGHHIKYGDGSQEPIISISGITVRGKTGTAQAPPLPLDDNGDGKPDRSLKGIDHAWFVGLAGQKGQKPKYAIAVLLERGGSGGKAAGPIAEQMVQALVDEGYFGDNANSKNTIKDADVDSFSPSQDPQPPEPEASEG